MRPACSRFLSLLLALAATTPALVAAEESAPGSIEVELRLTSDQDLPEDVLEVLWKQVQVAGTCSGEKIPRSRIDLWPSGQGPAQKIVTIKEVTPGTCAVAFKLEDSKGRVDLKVKPGSPAKGKLALAVAWARASVGRLVPGDKAFLEYGAGESKRSIELSAEPQVIPSRDYVLVMESGGERFDILSARALTGEQSWELYGTLVFAERVLLPALEIGLDGKRRPATPEMLLPARSWSVELRASGYRAATETVVLKPGATWRWTRPLVRATPGTVTLKVSGPAAWTVEIDGLPVDAAGPFKVDTGSHALSLKAPGWKSVIEKIEVQEEQDLRLEFTLEPSPIRVDLSGLPEGTSVVVKVKGGETLAWDVGAGKAGGELLPGRYLVVVEAPERLPWQHELRLATGDGPQSLAPELPTTVVDVRWTGLPSGAALTVQEEGKEPRKVDVADGEATARVDAVRVVWTAQCRGMLALEDALDLEPGAPAQEVPVEMLPDPSYQTKVRTIAFASAGGGLAAIGIALLAGSGGSYATATEAHEEYLALTDPAEIVSAKERRDKALATGRGAEATGWIMVGSAAGTGVAGLVTWLITRSKGEAPPVEALLAPRQGGAVLGLAGRW